MIPTPADCYDLIREELGDTEVSGGQVFTNTKLLPIFNRALEPLLLELGLGEASIISREFYHFLPQYQSTLNPLSLSNNFSQLEKIWERGNVTRNSSVSGIVYSSSLQTVTVTFSGSHGLGTLPKVVECYGAVDAGGKPIEGLNGRWVATETNGSVIVLHGVVYAETYSSGLVVMTSDEDWGEPISAMKDSEGFSETIGQTLGVYVEKNGLIRFPFIDQGRELKIEAQVTRTIASGTDSLLVDSSREYFVCKVAHLALGTKASGKKADELDKKASQQLRLLKAGVSKSNQKNRYFFAPYSPV